MSSACLPVLNSFLFFFSSFVRAYLNWLSHIPSLFLSLPTSIHADYRDYHDTVMRHACVFILPAVRPVFPCGEVDMGYLVCVWLLMPAMRSCSFWSLKHQSVALLLNACYALVFVLESEASHFCIIAQCVLCVCVRFGVWSIKVLHHQQETNSGDLMGWDSFQAYYYNILQLPIQLQRRKRRVAPY